MSDSGRDENRKRKLTPFLAHEMLFDFATGELDADRKQAVEDFIENDRESQNLLEAIRRGMDYAGSLSKIELSEEMYKELEQAENFVSLSRRLARWSEWPDSLRWSIVALFVSVCTAGVVVVIPWRSVPLFRAGPTGDSSSIEVARVDSKRATGEESGLSGPESETPNVAANDSGPVESSGDEEFAEESSGEVPARPVVAQPPVVKSTATPVAIAKATPIPAVPPKAVAVAPPVVPSAPAETPAAATSSKSRGFVYRAFMTLADLENVSPKITQQIKELGAEKAGEVELGWRRGTGRYYHFTIGEPNEQKLLEVLRTYGPVRISKDPHPRVMPEGQVRFILWIEAGN